MTGVAAEKNYAFFASAQRRPLNMVDLKDYCGLPTDHSSLGNYSFAAQRRLSRLVPELCSLCCNDFVVKKPMMRWHSSSPAVRQTSRA